MINLFAVLTLIGLSSPPIQSDVQAFVGAKILTATGKEIEKGVLLVKAGKIVGVGDSSLPVPAGTARIDVSGKTIMPGLVDTHSHIAGPSGGDSSATLNPDARAYDSINVQDKSIRRAQAGGITTANVMPGSGHLMSGQTVYLKLRKGKVVDDLTIPNENGAPSGGMKMANGTNPIRPGSTGTRGKSAAMVRELFIQAQEYRDKVKAAGGDAKKMPPRDLGMEALGEVLAGTRIVQHHTHRADDIMTVLRLQKEFGFKVVLHHVSEGWKVADEIAKAGVPCSIIMIDAPGGKLEAVDLSFKTGAALDKAGALVAYHTDDGITDSRLFLRSAAIGIRAGLSRETAIRSITINGAKMLGLDDRIGSLEVGKDADFVVLNGDPFSVYTKILQTWVDGKKVFDRSNPDDYRFAVGGPGAGDSHFGYLCCAEEERKK